MKGNISLKSNKICKIEENYNENEIKQQTLFFQNSTDSYYSYLKEEMLKIKDQASDKEWELYGQKFLNFDESEIIRLLSKKSSEHKKIEKQDSKSKEVFF